MGTQRIKINANCKDDSDIGTHFPKGLMSLLASTPLYFKIERKKVTRNYEMSEI